MRRLSRNLDSWNPYGSVIGLHRDCFTFTRLGIACSCEDVWHRNKTTPNSGNRLFSDRRHNPTRIAENHDRSEICRNATRSLRQHAGGQVSPLSTYRCVYSARGTHCTLHCQRKPCSAQKGGSKVRHGDMLLHVQTIWPKAYARRSTRAYGRPKMQSVQCTSRVYLQRILTQFTHPSNHATEAAFLASLSK